MKYFHTTKFGFNWPSKNGNKLGVESTHNSWIFSSPIPFKVNEVKENPSNEKKLFEGPISLGFDEKFLQFVPETLEHSSLHFSDDQIASLIPKIGNKIEKKNCTSKSNSHRSVHFWPLPPQIYGLSSLFYYISLADLVLTWNSQNFVFITCDNQKLFRKNLWAVVSTPSPLHCSPKG